MHRAGGHRRPSDPLKLSSGILCKDLLAFIEAAHVTLQNLPDLALACSMLQEFDSLQAVFCMQVGYGFDVCWSKAEAARAA